MISSSLNTYQSSLKCYRDNEDVKKQTGVWENDSRVNVNSDWINETDYVLYILFQCNACL